MKRLGYIDRSARVHPAGLLSRRFRGGRVLQGLVVWVKSYWLINLLQVVKRTNTPLD